jgi:hypothetical protein
MNMEWIAVGYVTGFCEHSNDHLGYVKDGQIFDVACLSSLERLFCVHLILAAGNIHRNGYGEGRRCLLLHITQTQMLA